MNKRNLAFLILVMFIILITACNNISTDNGISDMQTNVNNIGTGDNPEEENVTDDTSVDEKQNIFYQNQKLGFCLEFPESWAGYYKIVEYSYYINVDFIGKSQTSKGDDGNGLFMFMIGAIDDATFLDSIKKIGIVDGIDYYYATATDYSLGALDLDTNTNIGIDDEERKLISEDWSKAQGMQKDIENILITFEACE